MLEQHIEHPIHEERFGLEPMSIGTLLDRAFYFYRLNFVTYLAYAAMLTLPFTITEFLFSALAVTGGLLTLLSFFLSIGETFANLALQGGIGVGTGILLFSNSELISVGKIWDSIEKRLSPIINTAIVGGLLTIPLLLTLLIPPVGLAILTLYSMAVQLAIFVVLYERLYGLDAIRRAWSLISASVWRVLGLMLLLSLFSFILTAIIGGGLGLAIAILDDGLLLTSIELLSEALTNLFILPLTASATALLYFDLRVRHEGLDVSVNAAKAAGEVIDFTNIPTSNMSWMTAQSKSAIARLSLLYTGLIILGFILAAIINAIFGGFTQFINGF